jgi:hypothetical protein
MPPKPIPAIEWDGLWMDEDVIYYLLECKHFMTSAYLASVIFANHVVDIDEPSMGSHSKNCENPWITTDKLKLFLAGEFWEDGNFMMQTAQRVGYSVLYESGSDLAVLPGNEGK